MIFMVCCECSQSLEYVLYEMNYNTFIEMYNWILMYKHGYKRSWKTLDDRKQKKWIWDEANDNMIGYMESEKHRYSGWDNQRRCYILKRGD